MILSKPSNRHGNYYFYFENITGINRKNLAKLIYSSLQSVIRLFLSSNDKSVPQPQPSTSTECSQPSTSK